MTPEALGLAGAAQLAKVQRTRLYTGPSFVADHILKPSALAAQWSAAPDEISKALYALLPAKIRREPLPEDAAQGATEAETKTAQALAQALAKALNKLAQGPSLYEPARFPDHLLSPQALALKEQKLRGNKLAQFNRLLLRAAFPGQISTEPKTETLWIAASRTPAQLGAENFLGFIRQYWDIENALHQRLDCSAMEDRLRVRDSNAAAVLGLFHRVSMTLYSAWAKKQRSQHDRTYPTWQELHNGRRWRMIRLVTEIPG